MISLAPCTFQEVRPHLTKDVIQRVFEKRKLDEMRQNCIPEKIYIVIEIYEREWQLM